MPSEEEVMFLRAVFWNDDYDECPEDAVVHVEDAVLIVFARKDGLQFRLLTMELEQIVVFVNEEITRQERLELDAKEEEDIYTDYGLQCLLADSDSPN